jgi:tripartite-type tricarboxylate transporter receptor subunit TctC
MKRILVCLLICLAAPVQAHERITIVLPFATGGSASDLARKVQDGLSKAGMTVVVENKPGAGGTAAAEYVANHPEPDSVMLITASGAMTAWPHVQRLRFNVFDDVRPMTLLGDFKVALVVSPFLKSRIHTVDDYVRLVRENPDGWGSYAMPSAGTIPHLFAELFSVQHADRLPLRAVAYRGEAPALLDLLGSQVPAAFVTVAGAQQFESKGIRILAVSGDRRSATLPDVPTFRELNYDITATSWFAAYVSARMSPGTFNVLDQEIEKIMRSGDMVMWMRAVGLEATPYGVQALRDAHRRDYEKWRPIAESVLKK